MKRRILLLCWILLAALPFFISTSYRENLFQHNIFGRIWEINLLLCALPYIIIFDAALLSLIVGTAKTISKKTNSALRLPTTLIVGGLATVICCSYLLLIASSWLLFPASLSFFNLERTRELLATLDLVNFWRVSTAADRQNALAILVLSLSITAVFWITTPAFRNTKKLVKACRHLLVCAAFIASIGLATRFLTSADRLNSIRPVLINHIAPQVAFFWGGLLYGKVISENYDSPIELEPRYSLDEYLAKAVSPNKRNVVLLIVEALRSDVINLKHQGQEITPNINQLAKNGHNFTHAYAQSSETSASQAAILLGQYPLRFPNRDLYADTDYPYVPIYDLLSKFGYRTGHLTFEWAISKRLTASSALDLAIDAQFEISDQIRQYLPPEHQGVSAADDIPTAYFDRANMAIIKQWLQEDTEDNPPFFVAWYLYSSHFPYNHIREMGPAKFTPHQIEGQPSFFYYPPEMKDVMVNRYYQTLNYIDSLIGQLIEQISDLGQQDNTVFIITGDHGELFHQHNSVTHGGPLYEAAIRVPMIIAGAPEHSPQTDYNRCVGHVDIAPTILELLGLPVHGSYQGQSMLVANKEEAGADQVLPSIIYSNVQSIVYEDAVIEWPWKLVTNHHGKSDRLINLEDDPDEAINLAGKNEQITRALRDRIETFRRKQLSYYSGDQLRRKQHFPPKHLEN